MTRFSGAANQTGAALPHVNIATLAKLELGSGTLYLMDAPGQLSWNGQTWLGVGGFGSVSAVEEGTDDTPKPITLTLSGIDSALVTAALTEHYYGKSCTLYSAWFDENGALLADRLSRPGVWYLEISNADWRLRQRVQTPLTELVLEAG